MGTHCRLVEKVLTQLETITLKHRHPLVVAGLELWIGIHIKYLQIETQLLL